MKEARFQYFYCTRDLADLPHPEVPTRDVTNTNRAGTKTEPNLERKAENWCGCRARFITPAVKRAQCLSTKGGQHYLILTTRHPETGERLAVGVMPFSPKAFARLLAKYPGRWSPETYLPYVADSGLKLVAFPDAFPLSRWMKEEKLRTIPGGQGGRNVVPDALLISILDHFKSKPDRTAAFLRNVQVLERTLKRDPSVWNDYAARMGKGGKCATGSSDKCPPRRAGVC